MPNRILKESICTSDSIDHLSIEAERLFYRLIVNCDDYGLLDARLPIIKSKCFPLKSSEITDDQLKLWLSELEAQNMIFFYENSGHEYLKMSSWERHQQIRAKRPKCPKPNDESSHKIALDSIGNQMIANVPVIQSNPIRIQSESKESEEKAPAAQRSRKSIPPTVEEVKAYCDQRHNKVDPERFVNFYDSKGWMIGKNKMKDWESAVRTWEQRDNAENGKDDSTPWV